MRYLLLFVMATLTAVGQSTKPDPNIVWFPDGGYACGHPDQPSTTPCRMPTDAEIAAHMPKPKKHETVKQSVKLHLGDPNLATVNDGVAAWDAPKPPVPEDIKDGTICDNLPETQKITCLMDLVAPEKAVVPEPDPIKTAQDGYDCTMSRTLKTITINCTLKEK